MNLKLNHLKSNQFNILELKEARKIYSIHFPDFHNCSHNITDFINVLDFVTFSNCINFHKSSTTFYFSIDFYDFPVTILIISIHFW